MTRRINQPPRSYDTFHTSAAATVDESQDSRISNNQSRPNVRTLGSAAQEAQRLATQGLWADMYTPSGMMTPSTSAGSDNHSQDGDDRNNYLREPPPQYTPSDTASYATTSPTIARAELDSGRLLPPHIGSSPRSGRISEPEIENGPVEGQEQEHEAADGFSESPLLPANSRYETAVSPTPKWKTRDKRKRKYKCCRRACWFSFALLACLWLMLPVLYKYGPNGSISDNPSVPNDDNKDQSPIPTWPVPDREYRQHETSRAISGTFKLYDLLDLETVSGSITAYVDPQPGNKPATLRIASKSGSINVYLTNNYISSSSSTDGISNRTFMTTISSTAGSIRADLLHGNGGTTKVSSVAGGTTLKIYTVGVNGSDPVSSISTVTQSGSQNIDVVPVSGLRVGDDQYPVRAIQARHHVRGSAAMNIKYPPQWAGEVHAYSYGWGSFSVTGTDLKYKTSLWNQRDVTAWRGETKKFEARLVEVVSGGSGSLSFDC